MATSSRKFGRSAHALRWVENAAQWLSGGVGALMLTLYSLVGAMDGDLIAVLIGVGVGGVLLGWVLAVRRLDARLRALRERLRAVGPREPPAPS